MPVFNVGKLLEDQGLSLVGVNENGTYQVADGDGNERTFNAPKLLADNKIKADGVMVNTPDAPLDSSPVSLKDRIKLSLGNTKGALSYLKNKYEDVALHPDNGLLVKQHGVWQKVDKEGMDAWELTKDVAEGVVRHALPIAGGVAGEAAGAAAGASIGAAAGAGVGSIPGAAIGRAVGAGVGAGAGEYIRTSLGRLAGTYDATPAEQLKDVGWEAVFNTGGQVIGMGVRPSLGMLSKSLKYVAEKAAPGTKELLSSVYGSITGAGQTAMKVAINDTDGVVKEVARAGKLANGDVMSAVETLKTEQVGVLKGFLENAPKALSKKFNAFQGKLLSDVPDTFRADVGNDIGQVFATMEQAGLGKLSAITPAAEKGASYVNLKFKMATMDDIEKAIAQGQLPSDSRISQATLDAMGKLVDVMNTYGRMPAKSGKEAAKAVLDVKRAISSASMDLQEESAKGVAGKLAEFSLAIDNKLAANFHEAGLSKQFVEMNSFYKEYVDVVKEAKRVVAGNYDPEIFVNKLVSNPGSQATAKTFASKLSELMGPSGDEAVKSLMRKEGAKGFVRWLPNPAKMAPIVSGTAGVVAVGAGAINPLAAAAVATQASPRLVLKQLAYGRQLLGFLGKLPESERAKWLANPTLVRATFATSMTAMRDEEEAEKQLIASAGLQQ